MKFKRTYKFAFKTAGFLFLSTIAFSIIVNLIFHQKFNGWAILLANFIFFCISFIIIQYRVERFIFKDSIIYSTRLYFNPVRRRG